MNFQQHLFYRRKCNVLFFICAKINSYAYGNCRENVQAFNAKYIYLLPLFLFLLIRDLQNNFLYFLFYANSLFSSADALLMFALLWLHSNTWKTSFEYKELKLVLVFFLYSISCCRWWILKSKFILFLVYIIFLFDVFSRYNNIKKKL